MSTAKSLRIRVFGPGTDRLLQTLVAGIVLTVGLVLLCTLLFRQTTDLAPENTPERTAQAFLTALADQDYAQAYSLLDSRMPYHPTWEAFLEYNSNRGTYSRPSHMQILSKENSGEIVRLVFSITEIESIDNPFGPSYYTTSEFFNLSQEAGSWKIRIASDKYIPPPYYYSPYSYRP